MANTLGTEKQFVILRFSLFSVFTCTTIYLDLPMQSVIERFPLFQRFRGKRLKFICMGFVSR